VYDLIINKLPNAEILSGQEMQATLSGKCEEIDSLRDEANSLSKTSYWPADVDCFTTQLTSLDDQSTILDIEVCKSADC